jgi:hypothetical protein
VRRIAFASVLAASAIAFAQPVSDPKAEAEALAKQGDFVGAAAKYKLAYASDPKPATICNVGVAYYKAKQLARAQLFLNRCLERGTALDQQFVDQVRAVLTSLEQTLRAGDFTPLDIVVEPAGAKVTIVEYGDDEAFIGARLVWLPFGAHRLVARAEGYADKLVEVDAKGRDTTPIKITLEKVTDAVPETTPGVGSNANAGSGSGSASVIIEPPPTVTTTRPSLIPAIAATGVSVAGIATAIIGYLKAQDRAEYATFAVTPDVYTRDQHAVTGWNAVMITGVGVGVVGAAAAGYLWSRYSRSSHVEVAPSPDGGAVMSLSGRW